MTRIVPSMVAPHNFFRGRMPQLQESDATTISQLL